ncbi:MAG: alkaline phosphatase [Planctomycetota bacterium]|jgi:alkaline phosphatase
MKYKNDKTIVFSIALVILAVFATSLAADSNRRPPKNIIIMVCDGCGYNHVDASGLYQYGKTGAQPYEKFPVKLAMSTYNATGSYRPRKAWSDFEYAKAKKTDSAAAATAMATGAKTCDGAIGVDPDKKSVKNIVEHCEGLGKATGLVTSVPWTHATPAGFAVHNKKRQNYRQISRQIIFESALDVVMGAGHPFYDRDGMLRNAPDYEYICCETWTALTKGTAASDADGDAREDLWTLIQTRDRFRALMTGPTPRRVCGTAQVEETLQQKRSGSENNAPYKVDFIETVPTLEEMALAAINVLDEDRDGFFLMIEGGAADWASHDNHTGRMIEEVVAFNKTVETVISWIQNHSSWDQTLLIVTADHETGYITGPNSGKTEKGPRWNPLVNNGRGKVPGLEWHKENHSNSLVPFYAAGCGCELYEKAARSADPVRGKYIDNTDVAKTMFALLKWHCSRRD